jgi:hypothetical protein
MLFYVPNAGSSANQATPAEYAREDATGTELREVSARTARRAVASQNRVGPSGGM